jgi:hypothetical protein
MEYGTVFQGRKKGKKERIMSTAVGAGRGREKNVL